MSADYNWSKSMVQTGNSHYISNQAHIERKASSEMEHPRRSKTNTWEFSASAEGNPSCWVLGR